MTVWQHLDCVTGMSSFVPETSFSKGLSWALHALHIPCHILPYPSAVVNDVLCRHASECPAYVTHDCYSIVYLLEVDGNCFGIPIYDYDYDYLFDIAPSYTRSFGGASYLHVMLYT